MTPPLVEALTRKTLLTMARGSRRTEAKRPQMNNGMVRRVRIVDFSVFLKIMNMIDALVMNPNMMMGRRKQR